MNFFNPLPTQAGEGAHDDQRPTVILVDGIWGRGRIFRPLCARLAAHGYRCLVPALQPGNAVQGVADLAGKLKAFIDSEAGPDSPLAIVGFSLGCIVSRYYLQELGGYRRTRNFFAVSGPHAGTWTAYGYFGQGARDVRPGSALLRSLEATADRLSSTALHAFWTPFDLMILPATSSRWQRANNTRIWMPLHRFVPRSRRLQAEILRQLELERARLSPGRPTLSGHPTLPGVASSRLSRKPGSQE